jgi:hypothetical protein
MGACTITEMTQINGNPLPARRELGNLDREVILQITPGALYASGGDTIDLTPYFDSVCYGAELLSCIDMPTAGVKWEINVNPAAPVTTTSTRITAHYTTDPADAGGQNIAWIEFPAGAGLVAFVTTWKFRGS